MNFSEYCQKMIKHKSLIIRHNLLCNFILLLYLDKKNQLLFKNDRYTTQPKYTYKHTQLNGNNNNKKINKHQKLHCPDITTKQRT
jgi:hypothetical protein